MRPSLSMALVLSLVASSTVLASSPLPLVGGDPVKGRDTFVKRGCLACHAVRGTGGKVGPDLATTLVGKGTLAISAAMLNHFPQMFAARDVAEVPTLPELTPSELDDVVAYLFAINFVDERGSATRGRLLFNDAGCTACHGSGTAELRGAPRLGREKIDASAIDIAQSMWNHGPLMSREAEATGIPPRRFEPGEFADVLAFLGAGAVRLRAGMSALPGDPAAGRTVFDAKGCAQCHIPADARTGGARGLGTEGWYQGPSEIAAAMWNHGSGMWARMAELGIPAVQLTGDDMADVISFLYVRSSAGRVGDAARGATVFEENHCARCHAAAGSAPELAGRMDLMTPIHFAAVMWNHAPQMHELLTKEGLGWPTFSGADVQDVVEYLRTVESGRAVSR